LVKKADTKTTKNKANELQTSAKEIVDLRDLINDTISKTSDHGLYIAKMDHLAETEDELVFLTGDEVIVIKRMTELCWLGASSGVVGALDPRLLVNIGELGLKKVPDWKSDSNEYLAIQDHKGSADRLEFYSGESVLVYNQPLSNGLLLGKCQNIIGFLDPKCVQKNFQDSQIN